jgi:hypothetical protein
MPALAPVTSTVLPDNAPPISSSLLLLWIITIHDATIGQSAEGE